MSFAFSALQCYLMVFCSSRCPLRHCQAQGSQWVFYKGSLQRPE